ncbi:unnamed protein product [Blepharisma stoltei]|uniref:Uncharacterized protein n=1 Tax=Blepharisma stoltei TaxID=1481888 RepID=A0AAU9JA39_9CILI|nr:unnamed protein product [Blepharisma stoltei]
MIKQSKSIKMMPSIIMIKAILFIFCRDIKMQYNAMMRQSNLEPIILCISATELEYLIISDKKKQLCRTLIGLIIWS